MQTDIIVFNNKPRERIRAAARVMKNLEEKQNMKTGGNNKLKEIEVRNSKGTNLISAVVILLLGIYILWLYLSGRDARLGILIISIFLFCGVILFIYSYFDRSVQIRISTESIVLHGKEYLWIDVKEVKLKVASGGGVPSKYYIHLVLKDNSDSVKKRCREVKSQMIGYDKSYSEIITYAKTYKKIHDENNAGQKPKPQSYRKDRRDMDARQLSMLKKTDEELLEIINDGDNQKAIDFLAARNELRKRREKS